MRLHPLIYMRLSVTKNKKSSKSEDSFSSPSTKPDIKEEVNKIKISSYNDSKCNKNPRFKVIDDITIVKIVK